MAQRLRGVVFCFVLAGIAVVPTNAQDLPVPERWETLYLCFLVANPDYVRSSEEGERALTAAHIQYQLRLQEDGPSLAAGGLGEGDDRIVGLTLLRAASLDEAQAIAGADPAVVAGRLLVRVREWWVPAGRLP